VPDHGVPAVQELLGTPAYLAPEVAQGNSAGFPSDVFSLGSTLYTALEGTPPFGLNNNAIALLHNVALGEITPPRQSGPLTPLLLRMLQRNPEQRPTMQQAHDALATLTVIQSALPEETIAPVAPTTVDATVSQPPTEDDRDGSPGRRRLLAGVLAVVLLAASVLVTVLISDGKVTSGKVTDGNAAHPPSTSGGPAQSLQPLPTQPGPSSPTQVIPPAVPSSPQNTPEQLQQAITDYYAP
jgi:serine/threonine protein kinase